MSIPESFKDYHKVSVGPRYVFFNTLKNHLPLYKVPYEQGNIYLQQARSQLDNNEITKNEENIAMMRSYIEMVHSLAETSRENEITFVENFKKILNADKTGELPAQFAEWAGSIRENFDYIKLMNLINTLLSSNTDLEKVRENIEDSNMELITQKINLAKEQFSEDTNELITKSFEEHKYNIVKKLFDNLNIDTDIPINKFQTQITELFSRRFNSIMYNIEKNTEMQAQIINTWTTNWKDTPIQKLLIGIVTKYLLELNYQNLLNKTGKEMAEDIMLNFNSLASNIDYNFVDNIINLLTGKARKTLEEIALTSRAGLGKMFTELERTEQIQTLKTYRKYGLNLTMKQIDGMLRSNKTKAYSIITKNLGNAIRKAAEEKLGGTFQEIKGDAYKEQKLRVEKLVSQKKDFFKERQLNSAVQKAALVKISGPSFAEFIASKKFNDALESADIFIPGKTIQLKTDAAVVFSYEDLNFEELSPEINQELKNSMNDFQKNFLKLYKNKGGGKINVSIAAQSFEETMNGIAEKVRDAIADLNNQDEIRQKILQALNQYVLSSITVKEYTYGNNETGFDGGSLGVFTSEILDNLTNMYYLGGITQIDINILYFVIINCGPDGIANGLENNVANYLLGAAAMMMFDNGFSTANMYIQKMIHQFGFMPKILQLYNIQGRFIPASFVYSTIYNSLLDVYQDIVTNINKYSIPGSVTNYLKINNDIKEDIKPSGDLLTHSPYNQAQERFDAVADIAEGTFGMGGKSFKGVDIKFNFLAGILDIFEAIPNAFNY